jgi:purine nucleosidase
MAMMVLLQSPQVKVLGITMVSGNAWEPEEVQHTLRMLELTHHTDVPVVPGAVFPLLRTEAESNAEKSVIGSFAWYGAWGDLAAHTSRQPYHGPFVLPPMAEGEPTTKPLAEDAAHFLIRQVRAHPHQVTIYAAGPLTNIALAISIDPEFPALTQGIVIMGGSLAPQTDDPEFVTNPRHEFNFWFDPEAAHITLRAAVAAHRPDRRGHLREDALHEGDVRTDCCLRRPPRSTSRSTPASSTTCGTSWPPPRGSTRRSSPKSRCSTWTWTPRAGRTTATP